MSLQAGNASHEAIPIMQKDWFPLLKLQYEANKHLLLPVLVASFVLYVSLVRVLRYRTLNSLNRRFGTDDAKLHQMSLEEAQEIISIASQWEYPHGYQAALQFALFRSYGIPTISKQFCSTAQLSDVKTAGKRFADTGALIGEWLVNSIFAPRSCKAIARTTWLHRQYRIRPDDLLFTISTFITEPPKFVDRFEWRPMARCEVIAGFVLWKEIGRRMDIPQVPDTYQEVCDWALEHEKKHMVPAQTNTSLSHHTMSLLLLHCPGFLVNIATEFATCLMDDRVRISMSYEAPRPWVRRTFLTLVWLRKQFVSWLLLPRSSKMIPVFPSENEHGKLNLRYYTAQPWYVKENFWNQWGPSALVARVIGLPIPSKEWLSDGYHIEQVGPTKFEQKGVKETVAIASEWQDEKRAKSLCPFA
ncbi:MAG: hypothetical protein M4579_003206 [Chaenotheca gracillima]|nr:MAG: hypothetical protein M4579_003206 [Chaenotheca gracillima]